MQDLKAISFLSLSATETGNAHTQLLAEDGGLATAAVPATTSIDTKEGGRKKSVEREIYVTFFIKSVGLK